MYIRKLKSPILSKSALTIRQLNIRQHLGQEERSQKEQSISNFPVSHLSINTSDGMHVMPMDDILRCEAHSNYTLVMTKEGDKLMVSKTLKAISALLPEEKFIRIHQSHTIRLTEIRRINQRRVILSNGHEIPVSRSQWATLHQRISTFAVSV